MSIKPGSRQEESIFLSDVAQEREAEGDLVLGDIGYGMPFRAGAFDGAIR